MLYLRTSVGVEIRQDDLLISCLQRNLSTGVFTHFVRVADYRSRSNAEVRSEIDRFFKSHRLSRENIVLGIPRRDLIVRHVELPVEVLDNLKQVVQYQVQSFEPTEEDKFCFDYALMKFKPGAKRLQVLVVMIRKSILDEHLKTLAEIGIRPAAVTGSTMALSNLFVQTCKDTEDKTFVLADLAKDGIEIIALRNGALVYTKAAAVAGTMRDALPGEVEQAAAKIRLGPDEVIDRIVLNGDDCVSVQQDLAGLAADSELMGDRIRFEMTPATKPYVDQAAISLGLAYTGMMRRPPLKLNLLPTEMRIHQTRWAYVPSIVFGAAAVVLLCGFAVRPIIQQKLLIEKMDQEIAALKPRVERIQALRSQSEQIEKKVSSFESLLRDRDLNLEILQDMTAILPPDTYLNNYQNQDGSITLTGISPSAEALIPKLEASRFLKDVVQRGQVFKDAQSGKDHFTFAAKRER